MAWTMPSGLTWLFIVACAVAGWLAGFGMGYRRGVNDEISAVTHKPGSSLGEEAPSLTVWPR